MAKKELITRAEAILAEVRGETEGASNAQISKPKNNLATFLKLHKSDHEKTSAQLDAILTVIKNNSKLEKKEADEDRKERQRQKREKREKLIESLKSGVGAAASAGKKVVGTLVSPFSEVWNKIADFLKFTVIGTLFNKALNWFGEEENVNKIKRIGRFLNFWWPSLLAGVALFFTPVGGFVAGAIGILTAALPKLAAILASPLFLKLAGLGVTLGGINEIGKMLGKDKEAENLSEAQNQSTQKIIEEGGDPGDAATTSQSVVAGDSNRMTDTNLRLNNDLLQLRNDPLKFNKGGFVSPRVFGEADKDTVPAMLTPGEFVVTKGAVNKFGTGMLEAMNVDATSTGNISKTPMMIPKVKGASGGNITPPSTIKISNSVVLPSIAKEKPRQQVREGSTIPTFEIASNANSRQYTLITLGLEAMV